MLAEGAERAGLREVDVAVDEARQDQPVADRRDREACMARRDCCVVAEIDDPPVLDHQESVGVEACCFLLMADMLPRIIDEVEERASQSDRWPWARLPEPGQKYFQKTTIEMA